MLWFDQLCSKNLTLTSSFQANRSEWRLVVAITKTGLRGRVPRVIVHGSVAATEALVVLSPITLALAAGIAATKATLAASIAAAKATVSTVAPSLDKYLDIVRKENGTVEKVDIWGKRRLEYPINKKDEGIYVVLDLKCESATVLEIDRLLNINDQILRTKVLRKDQ